MKQKHVHEKKALEFTKTAIFQYLSGSTRSVFVTEEYGISKNGTRGNGNSDYLSVTIKVNVINVTNK